MEQRAYITRISPLELTMREVRNGLSDYACDFTFAAGSFELLGVEPAPTLRQPRARVYHLPDTGRARHKAR